ncbi:MAG: 3-oxoacyl-ACP reductase [Sphingomonas sp.]|nr:MAG: 3-oxoacyl-ACP reductase [Sphingomonas sp.]
MSAAGMDPLFSVAGKVALVTGGTSGIGTMIARGFVRRGMRTYITSRNAGQAAAMAAELAAEGTCIGLAADFSREDAPALLAAQLGEREERLDVLVNNAGANEVAQIETATADGWDMVMDVNLRAAFFLSQQMLPLLRAAATAEDPARIINLGSIGGLHIPNWEAYAYGASKAALHHLTRALCKRLGRDQPTFPK